MLHPAGGGSTICGGLVVPDGRVGGVLTPIANGATCARIQRPSDASRSSGLPLLKAAAKETCPGEELSPIARPPSTTVGAAVAPVAGAAAVKGS